MHDPVLIAGPTASGKSALALAIAERCGGVLINADSMQVYRELHVLTARPTAAEEARAPHRLYGHISAKESYSVARWLADVAVVLEEARQEGLRPIIVGGTGLYFKALTEGLSPVPEVPPAVRAHWRREAQAIGAAGLHRALCERDPVMAARLRPTDVQRLTRALEVIEATGQSLAEWQKVCGRPIMSAQAATKIVILPTREVTRSCCDLRFDVMIEQGALEEVRALMQLSIDAASPALQAIGVRPLAAHLAGTLRLEEAIERGKVETRQFAKRQTTWLNRHMITWNTINYHINCENASGFISFIDE